MTISCMAAAGRRWRKAPTCSRSCATSMSAWPALSSRPKPMAGSWCRPSPAAPAPRAHVTKDAFERIVKVMVDGIKAAGPLDAVYLDLHGAMVDRASRRRRRRNSRARAQGDRQGPAAGGQPRSACQCHAGDGRACRRADRLSHLSACRHGRYRPRRGEASRAAARHQTAIRQGVPAIAVPDSDQLAMHQRPADQRHLPEAGGAGERRACRRCRSRRAFRRRIFRIAGRAYSPMAGRRPMPMPRRTRSPR